MDGSVLPHQLPPSWGQAWKSVQNIRFNYAGLQSTLPPEWGMQGAFPNLDVLRLWINPQLTGACFMPQLLPNC